MPKRICSLGFTLIELIAVIVVLSIASVVGAGFIVNVVDQYKKAQLRSMLVQHGTVAMEQLTRKLRMSAPNSVRVSSSGDCIEYLPLLGGAFYTQPVPDAENGMLIANSVNTIGFTLQGATPKHVIIASLASSEIYTLSSPSARVNAGSFGAEPYTQAVFAGNHRFLRNSINRRLLLAADPERFCVVGTRLVRHQSYSFSVASLSDASPGGVEVVMAAGVAAGAPAFALSAGSEDRNTAIDIRLVFSDRGESITLGSRVLIRNVP
jgi:MSHA biogenesis protein MshO